MSSREAKYWICDPCALKRNLVPFKSGNTLIKALCGWCDRPDEAWLTPICDLAQAVKKEN